MNDIIPGTRVDGKVRIDGEDIYASRTDVVDLRRRVGMVFQKSNPFPEIHLRKRGVRHPHQRHGARPRGPDYRVEESLEHAALWDEVKDRLHEPAMALSGGQQQRLCIARALAVRPEILLMDEPASAHGPIATQRIEELIYELKRTYTIVIVTHNMQQAARVSDFTAFFWLASWWNSAGRRRFSPLRRETDRGITLRAGLDSTTRKLWNDTTSRNSCPG
jgi:phosphate transport system ATP-binding protein